MHGTSDCIMGPHKEIVLEALAEYEKSLWREVERWAEEEGSAGYDQDYEYQAGARRMEVERKIQVLKGVIWSVSDLRECEYAAIEGWD